MPTNGKPRNETQLRILAYIKAEVREKGYPPSVREICQAVGLRSTSTVHGHLKQLEKKGILHRDAMKPRAMDVVDADAPRAPLFPYLAQPNSTLDPYPYLCASQNTSALFVHRMDTDDLREIGIFAGDMLVVLEQKEATPGELVVARVQDTLVVRRFFSEGAFVRLQPENAAVAPLLTRDAEIMGRVVSLMRLLPNGTGR